MITHHLILTIKNNLLVSGEGPTEGINDSIGAAEKN